MTAVDPGNGETVGLGAGWTVVRGKGRKPKARPRKAPSVTEHPLAETNRIEEPSGKNEGDFHKSANDNNSLGLVNSSLEHVVLRESVGPLVGLHSDANLHDINGHGNSCLGKMEEEVNFMFFPHVVFIPKQHVNTSSTSPHEVDINAELENEVSASSPVNTEECNTVQAELPATIDPLTHGEATISADDGDFYVENRQFETERTGKFQPVPKVQVHKEKNSAIKTNVKSTKSVTWADDVQKEKKSAAIPNVKSAKSVAWADDAQGITTCQTEYMNEEGSSPLYSPCEDVFDFSPMGFSDYMPTAHSSEHLVNEEEQTNLKEIPHSEMPEVEVDTSAECRRKSINECRLVDESEDEEVPNDGEPPPDCPDGLIEDSNDVENRAENEAPKKRARKNSKKPVAEKEKPVRKRKKANEASDQSKRLLKMDKTMLETPEDEINFQKLPLRDLIIFAEYTERNKKKEEATSETPVTNKCTTANSSAHYYNEEEVAFGWEFGIKKAEYDDEQENPNAEESSTYFNYQSHMEKTRTAIRQFGTDLSMVQQLFPDRTRRQVKLKYKKEERQHPLRLHEALLNCATGKVLRHSVHVLAEVAPQTYVWLKWLDWGGGRGSGSSDICMPLCALFFVLLDSVEWCVNTILSFDWFGTLKYEGPTLTTSGRQSGDMYSRDTNVSDVHWPEELAKMEKLEEGGGEEAQDFEGADVPEVQSPIKSCDDDDDNEDDSSRWSNYDL
ncbi:hypothetical protein LguiA_019751 [Lonicera macranthoides]